MWSSLLTYLLFIRFCSLLFFSVHLRIALAMHVSSTKG